MDVTLTTDGSCLGNPGVGGWACLLRWESHERVLEGASRETTNNRMELMAAIEGLRALTRRCSVRVVTDSEYLRRGAMEFLARWKSNGWKTASGSAVANRDLWEDLDELASYHNITWIHLPGHSGDPDQERCDRLAVEAARRARREAPTTVRRWPELLSDCVPVTESRHPATAEETDGRGSDQAVPQGMPRRIDSWPPSGSNGSGPDSLDRFMGWAKH